MGERKIDKRVALKGLIKESYEHPLVVVFTASWISQSDIVEIISEKIKKAKPEVNVITFDADEDENVILKYNIGQLPSAIIIKDQMIIHKISGTFSKKNILDQISN